MLNQSERPWYTLSLRFLLSLTLLLALLAWWRQRPKVVTESLPGQLEFAASRGKIAGQGVWPLAHPKRTITSTVRRADFLNYVNDGPAEVLDAQGRLIELQLWRDGVLRSQEYWFRDHRGNVVSHGSVVDGRPHGLWQWYASDAKNHSPKDWILRNQNLTLISATLNRRSNDSVYFALSDSIEVSQPLSRLPSTKKQVDDLLRAQENASSHRGPTHEFEFDRGRLISVDGTAVGDFLVRIPTAGVEARSLRSLFESVTVCRVTQSTPMHEVYRDLFRGKQWSALNAPRSRTDRILYNGAPLPHVAHLYMMLANDGLTLDYRYGHLNVVTASDSKTWIDKTNMDCLSELSSAAFNAWDDWSLRLQVWLFGSREHTFYGRQRTLGAFVEQTERVFARQTSEPIEFEFDPPSLASRMIVWPNQDRQVLQSSESPLRASPGLSLRTLFGLVLSRLDLRFQCDGNRITISSSLGNGH
ncbi:MAG: hypothetical protein AAFX06_00385 [Planctomycetota bacterium]